MDVTGKNSFVIGSQPIIVFIKLGLVYRNVFLMWGNKCYPVWCRPTGLIIGNGLLETTSLGSYK